MAGRGRGSRAFIGGSPQVLPGTAAPQSYAATPQAYTVSPQGFATPVSGWSSQSFAARPTRSRSAGRAAAPAMTFFDQIQDCFGSDATKTQQYGLKGFATVREKIRHSTHMIKGYMGYVLLTSSEFYSVPRDYKDGNPPMTDFEFTVRHVHNKMGRIFPQTAQTIAPTSKVVTQTFYITEEQADFINQALEQLCNRLGFNFEQPDVSYSITPASYAPSIGGSPVPQQPFAPAPQFVQSPGVATGRATTRATPPRDARGRFVSTGGPIRPPVVQQAVVPVVSQPMVPAGRGRGRPIAPMMSPGIAVRGRSPPRRSAKQELVNQISSMTEAEAADLQERLSRMTIQSRRSRSIEREIIPSLRRLSPFRPRRSPPRRRSPSPPVRRSPSPPVLQRAPSPGVSTVRATTRTGRRFPPARQPTQPPVRARSPPPVPLDDSSSVSGTEYTPEQLSALAQQAEEE